jgi:hypothetical protein
MSKQSARKLTLALTLLALTAPGLRSAIAQSTPPPPPPPPPTPQTVTGGDPVPTSPNVVDIILTILHVA